MFRDEFDSITDKDTSVEYIMTKEMPDNSRINMKKLQDTLKQFSNPEKTLLCYICGPPKMIQDVDQYLSLCNIPSSHIFYELWWWIMKISSIDLIYDVVFSILLKLFVNS